MSFFKDFTNKHKKRFYPIQAVYRCTQTVFISDGRVWDKDEDGWRSSGLLCEANSVWLVVAPRMDWMSEEWTFLEKNFSKPVQELGICLESVENHQTPQGFSGSMVGLKKSELDKYFTYSGTMFSDKQEKWDYNENGYVYIL